MLIFNCSLNDKVNTPKSRRMKTTMKTHIIFIFLLLGEFVSGAKFPKESKIKKTKFGKSEIISKETMAMYEAMIEKKQHASVGRPDLKVGKMVSAMKVGDRPEEMGTYMEGDILTVRVQSDEVRGRPNFRWPNGVVHYYIRGSFNQQQLNRISYAMSYIHYNTCVRFTPWKVGVRDYISIQSNPTGCWSSIGRTGGGQILNLQTPYCLYDVGTPIHEFLHALGIDHEQSRSDRDDYVTINWSNIQRGEQHNFDKEPLFKGLGLPYDYTSVMHYSAYAFSKNGKPTIQPKRRTTQLGQSNGLSSSDVSKINRLYNCRVGKSG